VRVALGTGDGSSDEAAGSEGRARDAPVVDALERVAEADLAVAVGGAPAPRPRAPQRECIRAEAFREVPLPARPVRDEPNMGPSCPSGRAKSNAALDLGPLQINTGPNTVVDDALVA
jgi:hypothetical protein